MIVAATRSKRHNINMPGTLLPLFPLPVVVFPRTRLPLHVFEERYKEMVGEAIESPSEFGIVPIDSEQSLFQAGCTVVVEEVLKKYPDGRLDIMTAGRRRFELLFLNEEKSYLRAEVAYFDDEEPSPASPDVRRRALRLFRSLIALGESRPHGDPLLTDPQLSFQIAQSIPDFEFQKQLLGSRIEVDRLRRVVDYLTEYLPKRQEAVRMERLAPTNGHGARPVDI